VAQSIASIKLSLNEESDKDVIVSETEATKAQTPRKRSLLCFLLTLTLPPINLLCVCVCVCVCVRRDGRRQMGCHPVLPSSPAQGADMFPRLSSSQQAALTREVPGDEHGGQNGALWREGEDTARNL